MMSGMLFTSFTVFAVAQAAEPQAPAAATSPAQAATDSPSDEELATARMHFANGVEQLQAATPNYQDAFRQFQLAYEKSHGSWKVMGNLGLCALKLERDGEALEFYEGYLREGGEEIDPAERSHIEREMLLIKGNMANVEISSSAPNARVSVSRQGSTAPAQIYELDGKQTALGLRSGTLKVVVSHGDSQTLEWEVTVAAGETVSHLFDFNAKDPAAADTAATPSDEAKNSGMSGLRIAGIVTASVGVGAVIGGAVLGALSQSEESKARDECINDICSTDTEGKFDAAKTKATVANILFISGGVLAATGITLVIVGGNKPASAGNESALFHPQRLKSPFRLEVTPTAQPGGGGILAWGSF